MYRSVVLMRECGNPDPLGLPLDEWYREQDALERLARERKREREEA